MTGPLIAKKKMEEVLDISEECDLMTIVPVGYPAENPECKVKKSVDELVSFVR